ncbi:MAG: Membrane protein involved in the export of O-antigen and teichoic acid [Candidatus Amesbacteria bacterium GW2011_GWA1_47_16]|uniref:Membrane protein involved in the export of O-antigen and teichoic acid n=3 Tax=Candidatus Amesiibacteriota TaxID=1752730 RepID=A0A0G1UUB2_9BACT|nr:MAG: Membrane protein involved in the export of O-antigen and teichoic acid [Candidatus Amesbacteria bacterium GW2011_GWA1_47_16]KKU97777.1 MAG: Membrane protein involved in the export of O-antigen and teichoic acid [Candidatus Amesbacteria bacterium GW2011_GWB1_48_13]
MNYIRSTRSGMFWTAFLRGSTRVVNIGKTALLARILMPSQFGVFGIVTLALSLLEMLTETGINVFLLQQRDKLEKYVDTAWFISIVRGALISLLLFLFSPFIAGFFRSQDSLSILRLACLVPLFRGFINPSNITFLKQLQFKKEFLYRFTIVFAETLVTLMAVYFYRSPAGLVAGMVASSALEVILSFALFSPRPALAFRLPQVWQIIHQGKWVTGFGILDYIFTTGDNIIVGRLLGEYSLGIYQNAYKLSTQPMGEINDIFYKVTFPLFIKMSGDKSLRRETILRYIAVHILLVVTIAVLVYAFAPVFISLLLGPAWLSAIPVVRILAFLGITRGITLSFNALLMSQGRQRDVAIVSLLNVLGLSFTIVPMVRSFGLSGAAYSAIIGSVFALPVAVHFISISLRSTVNADTT